MYADLTVSYKANRTSSAHLNQLLFTRNNLKKNPGNILEILFFLNV